jgi:hypothetical protein
VRIRRRIARRRHAVAVLVAMAATVGGPAAALAVPADQPATNYPRPVPESHAVTPSDFTQSPAAGRIGDTPADFPKSPGSTRIGDTPAEFNQIVAPAPKLGDTPVDYPGAKRAPHYTPTNTVTVERTIVRDSDPVLPVILASLALLVALGIAGVALARSRSLRLGRAG